jgi:hypothetical protein
MSYRDVTKDDVGKECEFSSDNFATHELLELECIFRKETPLGNRYVAVNKAGSPCFRRQARIRTSPLPDGWLPDDWRVLGDEELCRLGDVVVTETGVKFSFKKELNYEMCGEYIGMHAFNVIAFVGGNICVIRPRWRKVTKNDIGKTVYGKDGSEAVLKIIVDADSCGYDAICMSQMLGWCFSKLCDLKVENEGWHVTN